MLIAKKEGISHRGTEAQRKKSKESRVKIGRGKGAQPEMAVSRVADVGYVVVLRGLAAKQEGR